MVSKALVFCANAGRTARTTAPTRYPGASPAASSITLMPIGNRPLAFRALDSLAEAGIREVAVLGPPESLADVQTAIEGADGWDLEMSWHACPAQDGFGACLDRVRDFTSEEPFVVHLGDSVTKASLRPCLGAMGEDDLDAVVLLQRDATRGSPAVKVMPGQFLGRQPAGVYVLGPAVVQALEAIEDTHLTYDRAIITAVESLGQSGGRMRARAVEDWWRYRSRTHGSPEEGRLLEPACVLDANYFILDGLRGETDGAVLVDSRIQGAVVIDHSATVQASVVRGPALIGPDATIRDAYVGPYTSIAAGVSIDGAEIEHSVILPGASISHLSGRLEASVVGPNAKVFRDFALPKALRMNVGENATVSLA